MKRLLLMLILMTISNLLLNKSLIGQNVGFKSQYENGVLDLDYTYIDDLLILDEHPSLRIIVIDNSSSAKVSSAHLALLQRWINNGGILWFADYGFDSSLFKKIDPGIKMRSAQFDKESGADFDYSTGELFIKDLLPDIVIVDHKITRDISMLYVRPDNGRAGTINYFVEEPNQNITPIIYFKDSSNGIHFVERQNKYQIDRIREDGSKKIILFGIVEKGRGLILFDYTQTLDKKWAGPDGNEYDGPKFYQNIFNYSQ